MLIIFKTNIFIGARECYCNGTWGPEPCQLASIGQVEELVCTIALKFFNPLTCLHCIQISDGKAEEGLELLLELSINNTQRLEVLKRAFEKQSEMDEQFNKSFVKV